MNGKYLIILLFFKSKFSCGSTFAHSDCAIFWSRLLWILRYLNYTSFYYYYVQILNNEIFCLG